MHNSQESIYTAILSLYVYIHIYIYTYMNAHMIWLVVEPTPLKHVN